MPVIVTIRTPFRYIVQRHEEVCLLKLAEAWPEATMFDTCRRLTLQEVVADLFHLGGAEGVEQQTENEIRLFRSDLYAEVA